MHRNSQKRIYLDNAIYFVTTKTRDKYPYFKNPIFAEYMMEVIKIGCELKGCNLFGHVIIPNHIHVLIQPKKKYNISDYMHYIKRHSSRNIRILILKNHAGEDGHPRLPSGGVWQSSFHDHIIRDEEDLNTHIEYIKNNPIKHGLLKEGETYSYLYINEELA
ncbi:transposase [Patescibacteria group bacterium]|nr:transposase [Patescibacteria group bacterium]MBU1890149.1 transposase [Patescibacteria group bacterium]